MARNFPLASKLRRTLYAGEEYEGQGSISSGSSL